MGYSWINGDRRFFGQHIFLVHSYDVGQPWFPAQCWKFPLPFFNGSPCWHSASAVKSQHYNIEMEILQAVHLHRPQKIWQSSNVRKLLKFPANPLYENDSHWTPFQYHLVVPLSECDPKTPGSKVFGGLFR